MGTRLALPALDPHLPHQPPSAERRRRLARPLDPRRNPPTGSGHAPLRRNLPAPAQSRNTWRAATQGCSRHEVAVGTAIAGGPPRRSQRAGLPHWAPTLGAWRRSAPPGRDASRAPAVAIVSG